jgi:hypothetical protein
MCLVKLREQEELHAIIESNSVLSFVYEFCEVKRAAESFRDEAFYKVKEY